MKLGVDIGTRGVERKVEHSLGGSTVGFGYRSHWIQRLEHSFVRPFIPGQCLALSRVTKRL